MNKLKAKDHARNLKLIGQIAKLPPGPAPSIAVAVISTPRSGSNLFVSSLAATGSFGVDNQYFASNSEYFGLHLLRAYAGHFRVKTVPLDAYVGWIKARLTGDSGVFVAKLQTHQIRSLEGMGFDILSHFDRTIYVYRKDVMAQAFSVAKAKKSQEYMLSEELESRPQDANVSVADHEALAELAKLLEQLDWFRKNLSQKVLGSFAYEEFVSNDKVYSRALEVLDLGQPQNPFRSTLMRQATPQDASRILELKAFLRNVAG